MLVRFRRRLDFPSRNKKRWPANFNVKRHKADGKIETIGVPIKIFPRILALPVYQRPNIVEICTHTEEYMWITQNLTDIPKAQELIGSEPIEAAPYDLICFARLLAKIAHGFFIAVLDHEYPGFKPLLKDLILCGADDWRNFVGSAREWPPREDGSLHELGNGIYTMHDSTQYLAVNIRLFGHWGAPAYEVIVAERT